MSSTVASTPTEWRTPSGAQQGVDPHHGTGCAHHRVHSVAGLPASVRSGLLLVVHLLVA
ncbi:hypothetical protein [Streptomyces drozdowiczii]|uniref:Uncharacterized protein n=1 Tax=Streptomyces drozdowiczii TaxID=202862 RepID=A0ABY6Q234_9ACTN|nr:hypothetical protein [Streptomyces drozdowiczii]MCX0241870.1 hypothetical protein [Streptomyces drozdowiczii]UZK58289.1 hypothetical protein NEH16_33170 [Streptomyces drozdowiczii]